MQKLHLQGSEGHLPSLEGVTALLDAGLAGVGEAAGTGMATDSVGIVPGWGEGRAGPMGVLLCLGDLGLCVLGDNLGTRNKQEKAVIGWASPSAQHFVLVLKMATKHALKHLGRYYVVTENLFTFWVHLLVLYSTAFHREWGDFL